MIIKSGTETLEARREGGNIVLNSDSGKIHWKCKTVFAVAKTFLALSLLVGFLRKEKGASSALSLPTF